jgi:inosine/xanthosine triphosphate pyrophosphatase family protein
LIRQRPSHRNIACKFKLKYKRGGEKAMEILIGTTNPSKVARFQSLLGGYPVRFLTLRDLDIRTEPEETGANPLENAILKAKYYGKFFDRVVCNDSGLYIDGLALDDERQPGLHARTPLGVRLTDEDMIAHYAALIESLGGKRLAYYWDGIAVFNRGAVHGYMESEEQAKENAFLMVSAVHPTRRAGWPLDSMSINRATNAYFVENASAQDGSHGENIMVGEYRKRLTGFLARAFELILD